MSTTAVTPTPKPKPAQSGLKRQYLLLYNAAEFFLWTTLLIRTVRLLINQAITENLTFNIPEVFELTFTPLLTTAQTLAIAEILHSLWGLVRAPLMTTAMQVASRIFTVWLVLRPFSGGIVRVDDKVGEYAYLGIMLAWGITEMIRYGFFTMQLNGGVETVPKWWIWLRYNTFYVLYPIGISSECILAVKALPYAAKIHPAYWWFIVAVLVIYVPGSYILYTHMIKQKSKSAAVKKDDAKKQ
ncbi:tyrosine phosphatase-like protein [Aspergillus karnatakaensis]|uniref:protein tyrosine phosphatase-like domain-containing protein n=1 Tax=Aspergillus karnatakaensis TaxID=1810916 RepID=UPI003CCDCF31